MPDFDEIERLRAADPVAADAIPSSDEPGARALRERIVMGETGTASKSSRIARYAAVAAAAVIVASGAIVVTARGGSDGAPSTGGPVSPGTASCVESYSLSTLENREVAFDGTVESVDGDEVRFSVNEWFKGGGSNVVSLRGASTLGGVTSAGPSVSLTPGTRLLVAGDGGFAWSCGFTQPYEAGTAAAWRAALG